MDVYTCVCGHISLRHDGEKGLGACTLCSCDEMWEDEKSWARRCETLELG